MGGRGGRTPLTTVSSGTVARGLAAGGSGGCRPWTFGVTAFDGLDAGPEPTAFTAVTVKRVGRVVRQSRDRRPRRRADR